MLYSCQYLYFAGAYLLPIDTPEVHFNLEVDSSFIFLTLLIHIILYESRVLHY